MSWETLPLHNSITPVLHDLWLLKDIVLNRPQVISFQKFIKHINVCWNSLQVSPQAMTNKTIINSKGFTLIEIIAVLVILGIIAAVAIPKYMDMAEEARRKAAWAAIDEIKSRLSSVQGKYLMNFNGASPTSLQLYAYAISPNGYNGAANLANLGDDYVVTITGGTPILINVTSVKGSSIPNGVADTFRALGDI